MNADTDKYNNVMNLFPHNLKAYKRIINSYKNGENIVVIKHATGTGKTPLSLQLIYDYNKELKNKKNVIYFVPNLGIKEHILDIINSNPKINQNEDFSNLDIRTYSSLINMNKDELKRLEASLLILDEFHHLGAPVWGRKINDLIECNNNAKEKLYKSGFLFLCKMVKSIYSIYTNIPIY